MSIFFLIVLIVGYLSVVAAGIAIAGRWHGTAIAQRNRHPKWDRHNSGKDKEWQAAEEERMMAVALAWLSAIWPATIVLVIIAGAIGGTVWLGTAGVNRLFRAQSQKAMVLEERKSEMAKLNEEIPLDKKKKVLA